MREISEHTVVIKDNPDQIEAIKMIAKGLEALARVNADMSLQFGEAVRAIPKPEVLDLTPLIPEKKQSEEWEFTMNRDKSGRLMKIRAKML